MNAATSALGLGVIAGDEDVGPALLQDPTEDRVEPLHELAPAGATLAPSCAIEASAGWSNPSPDELKGC